MSVILKRILALAAALTLLSLYAGMLPVSAEESAPAQTEPSGYWKLMPDRTEVKEPDNSNHPYCVMSGSHGHYACHAEYTGDGKAEHTEEERAREVGSPCYGESMDLTIDIEEPPAKIVPGEEIALKVTPSLSSSDPCDAVLYTAKVRVDYGYGVRNASGSFIDSKGQKAVGAERTWNYDGYYHASGYGNYLYLMESDYVLRASFMAGDSDNDELWIWSSFGYGVADSAAVTYYYYEWVFDSPAEPSNVVVNQDAEATSGEDGGTIIDNDIVNGKPEAEQKSRGGKAAAVIAGSAAITGAAAYAASKKKNRQKQNENVAYRMLIDKDFGNTLHPGQTYQVYARIEQFHRVYNNVRPADELTQKITAFSKDFNVKSSFTSRKGRLVCCAEFTFDHMLDADFGTVSFKFTGKGGTFTENVRFQLDIRREISLRYLKDNGELARNINLSYRAAQGKPPIQHGLFLGDDQTNAVLNIAIHGFYREPTVTVRSEKPELAPSAAYLRCVSEQIDGVSYFAYLYQIRLNNRTEQPYYREKGAAVFAQPVESRIHIAAAAKDGAKAEASVDISVIPMGFWFDLSRGDQKQKSTDYMELYTDEMNRDGTGLKATLMPLRYSYLQLADPDGYRRIVSVSPNYAVFQNVKSSLVPCGPEAEKINNEFENYLFVTKNEDGDMVFRPNLPVVHKIPDEELMFRLYICAKEKHLGAPGPVEQKGYASARVYGIFDDEKQFRDRVIAVNRLEKVIKLFELENDEKARSIRRNLPKLATTPINHVTHWLIVYATYLQEEEYRDAQKKDFWCDVGATFFESVKWLDDVAFSIVFRAIMAKYRVKNPELAEALVTPIKELIEEYAAEQAVYAWNDSGMGELPAFWDMDRITQKFIGVAESTIVSSATDVNLGKAKKPELGRMALLLVCAAGLNLGKHCYYEKKQYDEAVGRGKPPAEHWGYSAFREFLKDISVETLKIALAKLFVSPKSDRLFKVVFDGEKGLQKKLQHAAPEKLLNLAVRNGKAVTRLAERLTVETIRDKAAPDLIKTKLDSLSDAMVELSKVTVNGSYAAYDAIESTAEAVGQVRVDQAHNLVIITAEHGVYKLPTLTAVYLYLDLRLEELGFYRIFGDLEVDPITLPEHCPYLSPEETIESLVQFGLPQEANYIRNTMTKHINRDVFGSTAQPGTFNARTDFRRYEK